MSGVGEGVSTARVWLVVRGGRCPISRVRGGVSCATERRVSYVVCVG